MSMLCNLSAFLAVYQYNFLSPPLILFVAVTPLLPPLCFLHPPILAPVILGSLGAPDHPRCQDFRELVRGRGEKGRGKEEKMRKVVRRGEAVRRSCMLANAPACLTPAQRAPPTSPGAARSQDARCDRSCAPTTVTPAQSHLATTTVTAATSWLRATPGRAGGPAARGSNAQSLSLSASL